MKTEKSSRPEMVARQRVGDYYDGLNPKTLANLNSQGRGPKPYKRGRIVFYDFAELGKFVRGEGTA